MSDGYKIAFERLQQKVKTLLALERQRQKQGRWMPLQDKQRLYKVKAEVENMTLIDEEGVEVIAKQQI